MILDVSAIYVYLFLIYVADEDLQVERPELVNSCC